MNKDAGKEEVSIRQYVFEARDNTIIDFDAKNETQLTTTLMDLQKLRAVHTFVIVKGCDLRTGNHARYDAFALTKQVLDILTSALHMTRQRAFLEAMSLL